MRPLIFTSSTKVLVLVLGFAFAGCAANDAGDDDSAGGSTSSGGSTASGGHGGTGGTTSVSGGTGGTGGTGGGGSASGGATTGGSAGAAGSGGTATGGSTGDGGGPTQVIGACDDLGEIDAWETATPPGVTFVGSVGVDPVNSGTLYVGTGSEQGGSAQGIHKSTDCGATWAKVSTGTNGDIYEGGGTNYGITVDWFEPSVIYSASLYSQNLSLLQSTNSGVDWTVMFPPGSNVQQAVTSVFTQEFSMDEHDHEHVVVSMHDACSGDYAPMCLVQTFDSGATWQVFKGPLDGWGENARPYAIDEKQVLFISYFGSYYTADSTVASPTWEKIAGYGGHVRHAANGNYYLASYQGTLRSPDGANWELIEGSPRGYAIESDGDRLFTAGDVGDNFYFADLSDDTTWTSISVPSSPDHYVIFGYDSGHHILYTANHTAGLLRVVTK